VTVEPDVIWLPNVAPIIRAIDQQTQNAHRAHFAKRDFLRRLHRSIPDANIAVDFANKKAARKRPLF
jgi:hypothetical protein